MEAKKKREYVIRHIEDADLVSDEAVAILLKLLNGEMFSKTEILEMSGYDTKQCFDTAYPQPYADRIREIYPRFNESLCFYDYSQAKYGEMRNVYNLFAKKILTVFNPQ